MAHYAAVATVVQLLDDIIHQDLYREILLPRQVILESLYQKFCMLLEMLEGYESRSGDETSQGIRDVADRAQEILVSEISKQIHGRGRWDWDPTFDEELVKLGKQVDSASDELLVLKDLIRCYCYGYASSCSATASVPFPLGKAPVVGFDEEQFIHILDQLTGYRLELEAVSIVGIAGIGKTTLATQLFHHKLIDSHFECRAWVTVSENIYVNKILKNLLNSLGVHDDDVETADLLKYSFDEKVHVRLIERIVEVLLHRRYLIVVDDLRWVEYWDLFRQIFPDSGCGSRIVLTTRFEDIAHYACSDGFIHKKTFLTEDESWSLLQQMVFLQEHCPPGMEDVGRLVASKCGGVPLAVAGIAGFLFNYPRERQHWEDIVADSNSGLEWNHDALTYAYDGLIDQLKALSKRYDELTDQVKACFLHLGGFPDDHEIRVSRLVKLWVAEILVNSVDVDKTLEQVAEECLEVLVRREFVRITKRHTGCNRIKFCTLWNPVRNFSRRRACDENFFHVAQDRKGHLYQGEIDTIELDKCKILRVMDVVETTPWSVLNAIVQMFHLKYLRLHLEVLMPQLGLPPLPSSISMLQNLQTLIIYDPRPFPSITLPPQIWKMTQLRHVIITRMTLPPPISTMSDTPIQKLEYLQTLSTLKDFIFTGETIEMIPNLRKLKISCTGIDGNAFFEFYCLENLLLLSRLEELRIIVDVVPSRVNSIWSNFALPLNLRKLSLGGCRLSWDEMTVVGSLSNLQILVLRRDSFVGEEWETIEGDFLKLKFLLMEMLDLKYWRIDSEHFPCLEHLKIKSCMDLEIPSEIGYSPSIRLIEVRGGSRSVKESARRIQEKVENEGLLVLIRNS